MLSGVPSTAWAVANGDDPLSATRAAGHLLARATTSTAGLYASAALAHGALSLWWTGVLSRLPGGTLRAIGYGTAIAALDLGLARVIRGPRFGPTAELALLPQLADHIAFAVIARASV